MPPEISGEVRYRMLKFISEHPDASQRDVARALDVSLGKVNYCMRALIAKGFVKIKRFVHSGKKVSYTYLLTRHGIEERAAAGRAFLHSKMREYDALLEEIRSLRTEVDG
jgi:EPS-associated MarR family transcriptional regulator